MLKKNDNTIKIKPLKIRTLGHHMKKGSDGYVEFEICIYCGLIKNLKDEPQLAVSFHPSLISKEECRVRDLKQEIQFFIAEKNEDPWSRFLPLRFERFLEIYNVDFSEREADSVK